MRHFLEDTVSIPLAAVLLSGVVGAEDSLAQDAGARQAVLEEVVVTARKRTESLMDVPVAATALSGSVMQDQGINDLRRIADFVPQLMIAQAESGAGSSFTLRGIGSSALDAGVEQSVAVVIDGAPISRGNIGLLGFFDVEQVEVLKGPQALFFGKNSPAGVISIKTAGPTETFEGYARTGYEMEAAEFFGEAAVSGPLNDQLMYRLAVRGMTMDGWLDNVSLPLSADNNPFVPYDMPGRVSKHGPANDELIVRGALAWEPTMNFDATLKATVSRLDGNGHQSQVFCDTQCLAIRSAGRWCRFLTTTATSEIPSATLESIRS